MLFFISEYANIVWLKKKKDSKPQKQFLLEGKDN